MGDCDMNKLGGSTPLTTKYISERMYKPEAGCACDSLVPQRFICSRCLSSFSLLGEPFPGRMVSMAEYKYPDLRFKGLLLFLALIAIFIPFFGSLQWNTQPKCNRCFNLLSQLLGID